MNISPEELRFWSKVDRESGASCWQWLAYILPSGYGQFRSAEKLERAHRVAYKLRFGFVPNELCVLHHCDNPGCVNPDHLFLGTPKINTGDMISKGRKWVARGEEHGNAKLNTDKVHEIRTLRGKFSQGELAERFRVCRSLIGHIQRNERWKEAA